MAEISRFWDGTVLGDCGPYSTSQMHGQFFRSILNGTGDRGPLLGWLNELEVSGAAASVTVATGAAIVYGQFYENTESVSVSVPAASSGYSRYDRIVVRRDWATQTIRVARIIGTEAISPSVPALTQVAAGIYEIPLATLLVDDAGTITVTDTRKYCTYSTEWAALTVDSQHFADGAVTADKRPDRSRYYVKEAGALEPDTVTTATWVAGANYDFWNFATGANQSVWLYDFVPYDQAGTTIQVNLLNQPDAAAAGNVRWDYNYAIVTPDGLAGFTTGNIVVAQGGRAITTNYQDALVNMAGATAGQLIILEIIRLGGDAADTFGNAMRLLGVELVYTAQA